MIISDHNPNRGPDDKGLPKTEAAFRASSANPLGENGAEKEISLTRLAELTALIESFAVSQSQA